MTEEDEEFERIAAKCKETKLVKESKWQDENWKRNEVLEEVAREFEKMNRGDTAASFAIFVRNLKR